MNIAQKESVTQLTLRGVYSLLDESKKDIIVQVLEPEAIVNQKSDNKSLKFKVFISDGYTKHKAVLGNEASLAFDSAGQPAFCVIRVLELMQQNAQPQKRLVIITKIELINTDIDEIIGAPIEYQEWLASNKQNRGGSNQIPPKFLGNFKSQNQANNYMNNNFGNTPIQNTANSFNRQQPAANQNQIQNQRAPAPASGLNNNFNSNQQAPSRNSMGGGNFNNTNNNNNFNNNNNQRAANNNNNSNKLFNQNENIPPSGGNNFKGQQEQKRGPVSYINHNNQFNVPEEEFLALNVLAPYAPFVIKVRVTSKSDLRTFPRQGSMGEGHVFSADLIDKEGNEITASFFGDAAQKFAPIIEENAVYIMRNGNVKMVNSKFNRKSNNDYQIVFDKADSFIQKIEEDTNIMLNKFNFVKLNTIEELPVDNTPIDVAAYIKDAGETTEVTLKTGKQPKKARRVITLYDNSNTLVEMTLWGDICNQDLQPHTLVLVKAARVSSFNNIKSLSSSFTTKIISRQDLIPDVPEINQLKEWKNSEFDDSALNSKVAERGTGGKKFDTFTIEEINKLGEKVMGDTAAFFDLYAHVSHIKTETPNLYYAACPDEKCKRKVTDNNSGIFSCSHCGKNTNEPLYRYTLSMKLSDHTGSIWISAFDAVAQTIIGHGAKEIKSMKDQGNDARIAEIFKDAHHGEFEFKLLAKMDTFDNRDRVKFQAIRVEKINYLKHGKALLAELDKYSQMNQ